MYTIEQQLRVRLAFRAMNTPVEVLVPWSVLRYLDTHAERVFDKDGTVIYRLSSADALKELIQMKPALGAA
jgi:hypothetical protein